MNTHQKISCFIFYFDVIGVVDMYNNDPSVLQRLLEWQREIRGEFLCGEKYSTCVTMFDNVWARYTTGRPEQEIWDMLEFSGKAMSTAQKHGFENFFGALTYGAHEYDERDKTIVSGGEFVDIQKQHIDSISEPHIRAAFAEKWSARLAKAGNHPMPNSIWVGLDALDNQKIGDITFGHKTTYTISNKIIDLNNLNVGQPWPFTESQFELIGPK